MKKSKAIQEVKGRAFSATEVGTMLEDINKSIKIVAEGHSGLDRRLENVEVALHGNSRRLDFLEISSRVVNDKVSRLEDAVSKLNKDLTATREELKKEIADTKTELRKDIVELGDRLTSVETRR